MRRIAVVLFLSSSLWGEPASARSSVESFFRYQLYISDHLRWQDGDGPVRDRKGVMAEVLDAELARADEEVLFALYGVRAQSWFIARVGTLSRKLETMAVVDQKDGDFGDWSPGNFTYSDTPEFVFAIGEAQALPDLNSKGMPRTSSIMHNKYIVLDRQRLWMGSANLSSTGLGDEYNANAVLLIDVPEIAEVYAAEFEQMYLAQRFSRKKRPLGIEQSFRFGDGTEVDVLFAPQDEPITQGILPLIRNAQDTLDITMFFLTERRIVDELILAARRGVRVRLILDALAARHPSSAHQELREAGVDVRIENWGGKMHMKAACADGSVTTIGSMNWSASGEKFNDENLIIIGSDRLGNEFTAAYQRMWRSLEGVRDPLPESRESINSCFDGIDNDYDFVVDAHEAACQ